MNQLLSKTDINLAVKNIKKGVYKIERIFSYIIDSNLAFSGIYDFTASRKKAR